MYLFMVVLVGGDLSGKRWNVWRLAKLPDLRIKLRERATIDVCVFPRAASQRIGFPSGMVAANALRSVDVGHIFALSRRAFFEVFECAHGVGFGSRRFLPTPVKYQTALVCQELFLPIFPLFTRTKCKGAKPSAKPSAKCTPRCMFISAVVQRCKMAPCETRANALCTLHYAPSEKIHPTQPSAKFALQRAFEVLGVAAGVSDYKQASGRAYARNLLLHKNNKRNQVALWMP
jgi:hypothetical protein